LSRDLVLVDLLSVHLLSYLDLDPLWDLDLDPSLLDLLSYLDPLLDLDLDLLSDLDPSSVEVLITVTATMWIKANTILLPVSVMLLPTATNTIAVTKKTVTKSVKR